MTTFYKTCLIYFALLLIPFQFSAANYYWIGGAGNWSDINHWATTSGGSTLHSFVPSQNDDVFFNAGSGNVSLNINTNATCRNMLWSGVTGSPIVSGFSNLNIYGSLILQSSMIYGVTNTYFKATTLGNTITTNSVTIASNIYFDGTGSWILQDDFSVPARDIRFNNGNLNTNGVTINGYNFTEDGSALSTRTLSLGASRVNISNSIQSFKYTGNILNAGTSQIYVTNNYYYPGNFFLIAKSGHSYYNITCSHPSAWQGISANGPISVHKLTFLGSGSITCPTQIDSLILSPNKKYELTASITQTITAALTATSNPCIGLIEINSNTLSQAGLYFAPGSSASVNAAIISGINVSGALAPLNTTNSFDDGNNTNINFAAPASSNLYWVGGAGNWNDQTHWALTSGGAGGACIPSPVDNVFFDANSGFTAGNALVTVSDRNQFCQNMTWNNAPSVPTIYGPQMNTLHIYGSVILQSAMTYSVMDTEFNSIITGRTITTNGTTIQGDFTFYGDGSWILQDNLTVSSTINLNKGLLNTNSQTVNVTNFSYSSLVPYTGNTTLTLGGSQIYISDSWRYNRFSGISILNAGTSHLFLSSVYPSNIFTSKTGHVYNDITFTNPGNPKPILQQGQGGGITVNNLTFLGGAAVNYSNIITNLNLSAGKKYIFDDLQQTILGTLTATAVACGGVIEIVSDAPGSQTTFSFSPGANTNISGTIIQDIRAIGAGIPITANNSIDLSNNTNINFTVGAGTNLYWIGGGGNWNDGAHWSFTSGGPSAFCIPTPNDNVFFNSASAFTAISNTVTLNGSNHYCKSMTWNGATNTPIIEGAQGVPISIFGSLTLQNTMVFNPSIVYFKAFTPGQTITSNGNAMPYIGGGVYLYGTLFFDGPGSWTFTDDLNAAREIYFLRGDINTNNVKITARSFTGGPSGFFPIGTRTLTLGSSQISLSNSIVYSGAWDYQGTNATLNSTAGSHILLTQPFGSIFIGEAGHTYHNLSNTISSGNLAVSVRTAGGTIKFNKISMMGDGNIKGAHIADTLILSAGKIYQLEAARTQTVTGRLYASGNPCFITFLQSTVSGSQANLNVRGGNVNYDYLNVRDINAATSYTPLNAAGHSTNAGNNINWNFAPTTTVGIVGLGPDITRCQSQLPVVLNTTNFYPNPLTQFSWTGGSTADSLIVNSGGLYNVTVNYGAGCTITDNITITANPTPILSITGNTIICNGSGTTLTANGAATYTWTSPTATTNTVFVNPPSNTTYTLSGLSAANCQGIPAMVTVSISASPSVGIVSVSNSAICSGNSSVITPGGASTYTLIPGNMVGTSFNVSPTTTTTYTINGTSAEGCINTAGSAPTTVITVNTTPTVGIASVSNGTICSGNNTVITPNGASTYTLMPGNMVGTSFNVSPSATTTYTINGTGATGCINTAGSAPTTTITVNTTPTVGIASVSNGTICSGNNTVITPNGASTYTLIPGNMVGTSFNVSPSATTTYTINGTVATGCINTAGSAGQLTITVNSLPSLAVSTLSNVSCFGMANGSVTLTPSGGAGSGYTITPASYTNLGPGMYTYTVTDANLCTSSSSLSITQPTAALSALAIATTSNTSCISANGSASVSVSGGTPSYTVNWSNGSTGASITNLNTGIHSYTVTDVNNCSLNTGTVSMSGVTGINTTASMQTTVNCFGAQTGALTYTTAGGTTYSYTLIPVASPSASITNTSGQFTGLAAGSYSLISIDLMSGCTDMILNTIAQPINSLTVSAITTASVLCYNGTASVTANVAGGTPNYNYVWETNTSTGNTATYTAGTYTLQVSDANGCTTSAVSFTVNQPLSALSAIAGSSANTSCTSPNGSFTVTANGGTPSYSFAVNGAMPVTTNVFSGLSTGSQMLTVMDINNCTYSLSVNISGIPTPSITLASFTHVTCFGDSNGSASLTVNGGTAPYSYNWSNGASANALSNIPVGVYTATVTDNGNCLAVTSVTITGPTALNTGVADILGACPDKTNGHGAVTVSGGTPNYSISWSNGVNGNEIKNVLPGVYTATVTDAANCVSIIAVTVPMLPPSDSQCDELFIPQIITPNGDGINDAFVISKIEAYPNNTLNIFNRWGSLVYSKKGYKNEWNGTPNVGDATGSNLLPSGTYFIILDFGDDLSKPYHGYVELKY